MKKNTVYLQYVVLFRLLTYECYLFDFILQFASDSIDIYYVLFCVLDIKMNRFTRSAMMQPMMNYGMGMAPFFKVNCH